MGLSQSEINFLNDQGLSQDDVFDGRFFSKDEAKEKAKDLNKCVVIGSPCRKAGHRLRSRAGHCVQCDTSKLAYERRYDANSYVYVAGSLDKCWIKIGTATDIDQRLRSLKSSGYGGADDWAMLLHFKIKNAGRIEHEMQSLLSHYGSNQRYIKQGQEVDVLEIFCCSFDKAYEALNKTIMAQRIKPERPWMASNLEPYKLFANVAGTVKRKGNRGD